MHKKLENDLMSLAHSILQMKNKQDVKALKDKSQQIYEKLSLLAFVEDYVNTNPNLDETKEELVEKVTSAFDKKHTIIATDDKEDVKTEVVQEDFIDVNEKLAVEIGDDFLKQEIETSEIMKPLEEEVTIETLKEEVVNEKIEVEKEEPIEQPFDDLEELIFGDTKPTNFKDDPKDVGEKNTITLEEELEDTIPVDVIANLFEPVQPKSLNDKLQTNIQIGLNDRIVFVKNLFEGSQEDFNRVVSQLNTFKTEKEAKKFIIKMVKPDYDWSNQEELENRLLEIIERRFA
ncbi:hypothetical protein BXQ17_13290 [Polaribacter sp. BM10]|uniref:hypothetical protein n=1 Tax=Polaribacter sp. BM10 TaxID=1529069 RepID=UPI000989C65E|nr:hypothetical protein [Polaribacter sp. BM10]AQS94995.1 hypothetical protein BXQ17_13290 [Polaribacter sp. BM10]